MDRNGNLTSVDTYDSDFSVEEIEQQTIEHFKSLDKELNCVDFTDEEFRGMLGYILGYTSDEITDDYIELRNALVDEVLYTTGKDLRKCWIWM